MIRQSGVTVRIRREMGHAVRILSKVYAVPRVGREEETADGD